MGEGEGEDVVVGACGSGCFTSLTTCGAGAEPELEPEFELEPELEPELPLGSSPPYAPGLSQQTSTSRSAFSGAALVASFWSGVLYAAEQSSTPALQDTLTELSELVNLTPPSTNG